MAAYLLLGTEQGKKKEFIEKITAQFLKKSGQPAQTYRFYLDQEDSEKFLSTLLNPSLFGDNQILIVSNAERLKGKLAREVTDYLKNPLDSNLLFLCTDETSSSKLDKTLVGRFDKEHTQVFWELFESDKRSWVVNFFISRKIKIQQEAISELLEMVTNDTQELRTVCSRLADYKGNGSVITADDWEKFLYHSKEENVFTLFEKMVEGKFESALEVIRKILNSGESNLISLCGGLSWQFRRLLQLHTAFQYCKDLPLACEKENIKGKRNQRLYGQALKAFSGEETQRCLLLLNQTDSLLKSGAVFSNEVVADLLLYRLMIEKGTTTNLFPSVGVLD